jgi:hypothetical protein
MAKTLDIDLDDLITAMTSPRRSICSFIIPKSLVSGGTKLGRFTPGNGTLHNLQHRREQFGLRGQQHAQRV